VLVMLSGIRGWVDPRSSAAALAGLYRLTIIAVSVACLAFVAFSAAARSSLAPAALAASAWGVAVAVVLAGLGRCLAGVAGSVYGSSPRLGLYGSLVAAVLLAVVAGCAGFRYRLVLPGMARRLAAFAVTALLGAAVCVGFHAAPRCRDLAARAATVAATFRTPAQPVVPTRLPAGPEPEAEPERPRPRPPDTEVARPAPPTPEPSGQRPPPPEATPAEPAAGPEPQEPLQLGECIWIEGEKPIEHDCQQVNEHTGVKTNLLSGGQWLAHRPANPRVPAEMRYRFAVEEAGAYNLWVRAFPVGVGMQLRLDSGAWTEFEIGETQDPVAMLTSGVRKNIVWLRHGRKLSLEPGSHVLCLRVYRWVPPRFAVDCLVLADFQWTPHGADRPPGS
jgi:hypothetical protein